ncbi:MAG: acyl carrier protein [Sphingobium sp.]
MIVTSEQLRELIVEVIEVDPEMIGFDIDRDGVPGWDSLAHLRIVTELESRFNVRLTMSQIVEARTVAQLSALAGGV